MKKLIPFFIAALLFMSCDETKKVIDVAGNVQLSGSYTVSDISGLGVASKAPTMTFTALDRTVRGNTGCNSFFGSFAIDLYALTFSDIASTEMACDQPVMTIENQFLDALRKTGSYSLQDNVLTLYAKNDRSILLTANKETTDQK